MKRYSSIVLLILFSFLSYSQNDDAARTAELSKKAIKDVKEDGWLRGGGFGLDLGQLLQVNPKVGAGENRLGLGGAVTYFAKYKKRLLAWDNIGSLNLSIVKLGTGILAGTSSFTKVKQPFQKSIDELRFTSRLGYKTKKDSKFAYAVDFGFLSQLSPTFRGTDNKNYIKKFNTGTVNTTLVAKLFSPAYITLAPGIDYKPQENLSFFLAPFGFKSVIVADRDLARLNIHGNKWRSANDFNLTDNQLGGLLKGIYTGKYAANKITHTSTLTLFSNYLGQPQNIDVDWINQFGFNIYKGFEISVWTDLFYDHDVKVQITDYTQVGGVKAFTGRRVSFVEQLLIKYNLIF